MQDAIKETMSLVSTFFEIAGVAVILAGFVLALWRAGKVARFTGRAYEVVRSTFGRSILLGLEILVAADLIRTIAVALNLLNITILGALVVLRTFLSWSLEVEISGRWPWQRAAAEDDAGAGTVQI